MDRSFFLVVKTQYLFSKTATQITVIWRRGVEVKSYSSYGSSFAFELWLWEQAISSRGGLLWWHAFFPSCEMRSHFEWNLRSLLLYNKKANEILMALWSADMGSVNKMKVTWNQSLFNINFMDLHIVELNLTVWKVCVVPCVGVRSLNIQHAQMCWKSV